jgi:sulfur-oxidizing protein SoxX
LLVTVDPDENSLGKRSVPPLKNLQPITRSGVRLPAFAPIVALCILAAAAPGLPAWGDEPAGRPASSLNLDVDGIPEPLAGARGDAERGRALLVERAAANCLLCHAVADPTMRVAGNVAPSLDGVGRRLSAAQLRQRVADIQRVNPGTAMPSYYRTEGLDRVAAEYRGKPILDARQVEDIVAYLVNLK